MFGVKNSLYVSIQLHTLFPEKKSDDEKVDYVFVRFRNDLAYYLILVEITCHIFSEIFLKMELIFHKIILKINNKMIQ